MSKIELAISAALAALIFLFTRGFAGQIIPLLFLAGLVYFLVARTSLGGSRQGVTALEASDSHQQVTFEEVGGQHAAKRELLEALDFIKHHRSVSELGIRPLRGILLSGPPGTGKTLLAKAAANYTDSAFLATSGSAFIEMYAGVGAKRVRELFNKARKKAKRQERDSAIVFIDEIEVLGGERGRHASHMEYDQTLNQLLVEMDGMSADDEVRVLVVGATNRQDLMDRALLRPGRFDRVVRVDLPDLQSRQEILKLHSKNKPLSEEVDLQEVARATFGFSGAHLEKLCNEAAIMAFRRGEKTVRQVDFDQAIEKVIMGEKMESRPSEEELRRVAIHEAGHAVVGEILQKNSVASVTISPRGESLGHVRQIPQEDINLYTEDYLSAQIGRCIAGAVAERMFMGNQSTGVQSDFEQATNLARQMVVSGMSELGMVSEELLPQEQLHGAVSEILAQKETQVEEILSEYSAQVKQVADELLEKESMEGDALRDLLSLKPGA